MGDELSEYLLYFLETFYLFEPVDDYFHIGPIVNLQFEITTENAFVGTDRDLMYVDIEPDRRALRPL